MLANFSESMARLTGAARKSTKKEPKDDAKSFTRVKIKNSGLYSGLC